MVAYGYAQEDTNSTALQAATELVECCNQLPDQVVSDEQDLDSLFNEAFPDFTLGQEINIPIEATPLTWRDKLALAYSYAVMKMIAAKDTTTEALAYWKEETLKIVALMQEKLVQTKNTTKEHISQHKIAYASLLAVSLIVATIIVYQKYLKSVSPQDKLPPQPKPN